MNKRVRTLMLSVIIILAGVVTTSAQTGIVDSMDFQDKGITLTLDQAMQVMLKDNPTLIQANADVNSASVTREQLQLTIDVLNRAPNANQPGNYNYENLKYNQMKAEYTTEKAKRNLDATILGLKADIEQSYYSLLQTQQSVDINKSNLDLANDLYNKVKKKYDLGLVAKQEVLSNEQNVISAKNTYNASINDLKKAKMSFNTKLGYDVMTDVKLMGQLTYKEYKVESIAKAVSDALANRNDVYAAQYDNDLNVLNLSLVLRMYPEATIQYRTQKVITDGKITTLKSTLKTIEMDVRSNYLDLIQKYDTIKSSEKSVEVATEVLKIRQVTYDTGMGLLTDVQDAQSKLQSAKLGLSKAILDYNLAISKFKDSTGQGRTKIILP